MARDWPLGTSAFLAATGFGSEAEWKRSQTRIMQHAHIGFRSVSARSRVCAKSTAAAPNGA
ncbi:MAG: hypothetical protein LCH69_17645 [Proteobacteria bacterium]|nr:hypothetical protein [Pseudomonadota bacterium]